MKPSVLERLLVQDRPRRKMHDVGEFSDPVSLKHPVIEGDGPWVGTLSSGRLVPTRPSVREPEVVLTAFTHCPIAEEDTLLGNAFKDLCTISEKSGWANLSRTLGEGVDRMRSRGLEPKAIVVPFSSIKEVTGEDLTQEEADRLSLTKGCIAEVHGIKILSARDAIPDKTAIITTVPALTGAYIRVLDRLTLLLHRADTIVLVR